MYTNNGVHRWILETPLSVKLLLHTLDRAHGDDQQPAAASRCRLLWTENKSTLTLISSSVMSSPSESFPAMLDMSSIFGLKCVSCLDVDVREGSCVYRYVCVCSGMVHWLFKTLEVAYQAENKSTAFVCFVLQLHLLSRSGRYKTPNPTETRNRTRNPRIRPFDHFTHFYFYFSYRALHHIYQVNL